MVEKLQDGRERYANFVIPTLQDPFEAYITEYDDGQRTSYIGLFTGPTSVLVVARINTDGSLFYNVMQGDLKGMNKKRVGHLVYIKK